MSNADIPRDGLRALIAKLAHDPRETRLAALELSIRVTQAVSEIRAHKPHLTERDDPRFDKCRENSLHLSNISCQPCREVAILHPSAELQQARRRAVASELAFSSGLTAGD